MPEVLSIPNERRNSDNLFTLRRLSAQDCARGAVYPYDQNFIPAQDCVAHRESDWECAAWGLNWRTALSASQWRSPRGRCSANWRRAIWRGHYTSARPTGTRSCGESAATDWWV